MSLLTELRRLCGMASYRHHAPSGAENPCHQLEKQITTTRAKALELI